MLPEQTQAQPAPSVCTSADTFANVAMLALTRSNAVFMILPDGSRARRLALSGVNGTLIGFDNRPSDGIIYGVADSGEIYSLAMTPTQVIASQVGTLDPAFGGGVEALVDFNPTNNGNGNALRLIGRNDQNYAVVGNNGGPPTGTVVQTSLQYVAGDPAAGANPSITAGAYDTNIDPAPATTFFAIDSDRNTFVTINDRTASGSSNTGGGVLRTIGSLVDSAGVALDVDSRSGLDIYTPVANQNIAVGITGRSLFCIDLGGVNPDAPAGTTVDVVAQALPRESASLSAATMDDLLDVAVVPLQPADLTIQVFDSPDPVSPGETLQYRVLIQNQGPFDAVNVVASNTQIILNGASADPSQGSCSSPSACSLGSLVSGASATVYVRGTVPSGLRSGDTFSGNFSASSANPDANPANNATTTVTTVR